MNINKLSILFTSALHSSFTIMFPAFYPCHTKNVLISQVLLECQKKALYPRFCRIWPYLHCLFGCRQYVSKDAGYKELCPPYVHLFHSYRHANFIAR